MKGSDLMTSQKRAEIILGAIRMYAPQPIDFNHKTQWLSAIERGIKDADKREAQSATSKPRDKKSN